MNWQCTSFLGNLNGRKNCLTFYRLDEKLSHGYEQIHQQGAEIDELVRRKERSKKMQPKGWVAQLDFGCQNRVELWVH